jgi:hypothetical protein
MPTGRVVELTTFVLPELFAARGFPAGARRIDASLKRLGRVMPKRRRRRWKGALGR